MTPQVGDKVYISSHYNHRIDTIIKVTKTQVTMSDGKRFVINTGRNVGGTGSWNRLYFHVITPAKAEELQQTWEMAKRKADLVRKLGKYDWATREIGTLESIVAILEDACPDASTPSG